MLVGPYTNKQTRSKGKSCIRPITYESGYAATCAITNGHLLLRLMVHTVLVTLSSIELLLLSVASGQWPVVPTCNHRLQMRAREWALKREYKKAVWRLDSVDGPVHCWFKCRQSASLIFVHFICCLFYLSAHWNALQAASFLFARLLKAIDSTSGRKYIHKRLSNGKTNKEEGK